MLRRRVLIALASAPAFSCGWARAARADDAYPARPIKILVGTAAGGPNDFGARAAGQLLGDGMAASVVIENRAGAGGTIAAAAVARAPADGYTLFMASEANMCAAPHVYANIGYDPLRDFSPIGTIGRIGFVAVVHPSVPATSIAELMALAKARPGRLNYGSAGAGTVTHLSAELFKSMAGIDMTHVPYKGGAPAMADLVAGHIDVMFDSVITSVSQIEAGKVRALGQTGAKRSGLLPNLPTIAEAGLPGYDSSSWLGLVGPAGLAPQVVAKLNATIGQALAASQVMDRLVKGGLEPEASTPEALTALIRADLAKWAGVAKAIGLKRE